MTAAMVAVVLHTGATIGAGAVSPADARVAPSDFGFNDSFYEPVGSAVDVKPGPDAGKQARTELAEGLMFYLTAWLSHFSLWSYENPGLARDAMLAAPWLLIWAVALRLLAHGALVIYVLVTEYRARR